MKTGKIAETLHGGRNIIIRREHKAGADYYVFKDGKPVWGGWEVIAISNSPGSLSAHRHFGIFPTYDEAKDYVATLPDKVPIGFGD